jgi:PAS domain-containing protein
VVCDADGQVRRYLAIQEDVTELRARERCEAQLQAMTQKLMAAASEGIVVTDAAQRITSFGAGADRPGSLVRYRRRTYRRAA